MRGEKEESCFNKVKNALFFSNGKPICNFLNGCSYCDVDTESFAKEYLFYCNSYFQQNYFGLLEDERIEFANIIRTAKPNPSSSEFPDFIFDNGFIEHFQITSSQVTRKGATHTRIESNFKCRVNVDAKKIKEEWEETPSFDKIRSKEWVFQNPVHSHSFLIDSFKKNWEHHLMSREKYSGNKKIGIFMIEYPEVALAMCENVYGNWIDGMAHGDMRDQENFNEYRLSRDKELLKYIYDYKSVIKYVVFMNPVRCEVIRTEKILYLLNLMPWEYLIYPMQVYTVSTMSNITMRDPFEKGDGEDE